MANREPGGTAAGTRRKRRPKNVCPNPLFAKWVEEWRDEAREKGIKSQYSYTRALNSIMKYPLPLTSGQEAKILDHVGEKLAKMLDKKLTEHLASGGTLDGGSVSPPRKKASKRAKVSSDPPLPDLSLELTPTPASRPGRTSCNSQDSTSSADARTPTSSGSGKKPKRKRTAREYIPVYRSGPYGILVALYKAEQRPSYCGYLNKSQLLSQAQPYCDTSFTVPDEGSYYTAWSSMSTLIKKGFVSKDRHPPRFSLTDSGVTLAIRMLKGSTAAQDQGSQQSHDQLSQRSQPLSKSTVVASARKPQLPTESKKQKKTPPILLVDSPPSSPCSDVADPYVMKDLQEAAVCHTSDGEAGEESEMESPLAAYGSLSGPRLRFWYVNSTGNCVQSKDDAAVTFNETVSVGFLVKCEMSLLESLSVRYTLDPCRKQEGHFVYAYLCNDNAPDYSDPPETEEKVIRTVNRNEGTLPCQREKTRTLPEPSIILSDSDSDMEVAPLADRIGLSRDSLNGRVKAVGRNPTTSDQRHSQMDAAVPSGVQESTRSKDRDLPQSLTPSQAAGLAALKRIQGCNTSSRKGFSSPPPVLDLTVDDSDGDVLREDTRLPVSGGSKPRKYTSVKVASSSEESSHRTLCDLTSTGDAGTGSTFTACTEGGRKRKGDYSLHSSGNKRPARSGDPKLATSDGPSSVRHQASSAKAARRTDQTPSLSSTTVGRSDGGCSSARSPSAVGGSLTQSALEKPTTSKGLDAGQNVDLSNPEFVLRPGRYEVVLCVDNAESTASRKSSAHFRGLLLQDLGKNGVKFDVRKLNVGDFVWVAKEKAVPLPGQLGIPPSREIVLEYVVERKRMDDLDGSITDGRFLDQKFRLKQCGVRHPVYLVEEFGGISHLKLSERALEQAVANTQIIDGFFVKRTKDIRDSVAYLTIMTRSLQQHYSNKTIKAYPWDTVVQLNKSGTARHPDVICSIAFDKFNEVSVKNKGKLPGRPGHRHRPSCSVIAQSSCLFKSVVGTFLHRPHLRVLSVYEMFGRHLIALPNFSADKAVAVLEIYPTVSHLREAYRKCETESERETLLSNIRAGRTKKKLGPIISRLIYSLYWKGT